MKIILNSLFLIGAFSWLNAQSYQVLKGIITDVDSEFPIEYARVKVTADSTIFQTYTGTDGKYHFDAIPVGRVDITVTSLGFVSATRRQVLVTTGKEVIANFSLESQVVELEGVEITTSKKGSVKNENTNVSSRSFSVEETSRYAGSRNDPARMAQNYAGVSTSDDSRNDIIIRGNSPIGLKYMMNDVAIPNPNHFAAFGTTGGPVSMLNNNVLDNSDFLTSAFPAGYGNALSGVFDLNLRSGNSGKREFLGQIGFNGLELGAEGPFKKGRESSYLINYRYSTLGLFKLVGIDFGTAALPEYQDLSFSTDFFIGEASKLTIFGLGGVSDIEFLASQRDDQDFFSEEDQDLIFSTKTGVIGANYQFFSKNNSYSKISIALSAYQGDIDDKRFETDSVNNRSLTDFYGSLFRQTTTTINYKFNTKVSNKVKVTAGINNELYKLNLKDSTNLGNITQVLSNIDEWSTLHQLYGNVQFRASDKFILNTGLHGQYFSLSNHFTIEPRMGATYKLKNAQSLNLGIGVHSQLQPLQVYYFETLVDTVNQVYTRTNEKLDFTKSAHFVLGYDKIFKKDWKFKAEAYYQVLYDVPVETRSSSYSILNSGADFGIERRDSLLNDGTGENYGIELTLEKFLTKGFYSLFTSSIFNSEYKGSDGVKRNSAFNTGFVFNALVGKEFNLSKKNSLFMDSKLTLSGGRRYTKIDEQLSIQENEIRFIEDTYTEKYKNYFRLDVKVGFRKNGKKATQEWILDLQNVTNNKNIFSREFNIKKQQYQTTYQLGLFPVVQYKVNF